MPDPLSEPSITARLRNDLWPDVFLGTACLISHLFSFYSAQSTITLIAIGIIFFRIIQGAQFLAVTMINALSDWEDHFLGPELSRTPKSIKTGTALCPSTRQQLYFSKNVF